MGEMRGEMGETTAGSELEERWSEVEGRGTESPEEKGDIGDSVRVRSDGRRRGREGTAGSWAPGAGLAPGRPSREAWRTRLLRGSEAEEEGIGEKAAKVMGGLQRGSVEERKRRQ